MGDARSGPPGRVGPGLVEGQRFPRQRHPLPTSIGVGGLRIQEEFDRVETVAELGERGIRFEPRRALGPDEQEGRQAEDDGPGHRGDARAGGDPRVPPRPLPRPLGDRRLGGVLQGEAREVPLDILVEFAGRPVAPGRVGLQQVVDDRFLGRRDPRVDRAHARRPDAAVLDHPADDVLRRSRIDLERVPAGEQLEEDHAERIEVAPRVDRAAGPEEEGQRLGRHVGERAADRGALGAGRVVGEVEVEDHRLAVVREQDVGRLDVAVEDAALVRVGQAVGQARSEPEDGPDERQAPELAERLGELDRRRLDGPDVLLGLPVTQRRAG